MLILAGLRAVFSAAPFEVRPVGLFDLGGFLVLFGRALFPSWPVADCFFWLAALDEVVLAGGVLPLHAASVEIPSALKQTTDRQSAVFAAMLFVALVLVAGVGWHRWVGGHRGMFRSTRKVGVRFLIRFIAFLLMVLSS
jgi:hypothetical protein